jgi:transposase
MRTFNHNYPSDITREQFEIIRMELENVKKKTKPREIDLYSIFCAILYLIKSGCQWDMLPSDCPNRSTVRNYYDIWSRESKEGTTILAKVLKKIGNNAPKR